MRTTEAWLWRFAAVIVAVMWGGGAALGQCGGWLAGVPLAGIRGFVACSVEWDPDGAGPRSSVLVFGGAFAEANGVLANGIVAYDRATRAWTPLGSGISPRNSIAAVRALAVLPNGDLVAAGTFSNAGGAANTGNIAAWNGSQWRALGAGLSSDVYALAVTPDGDLIGGGRFARSGQVSCPGVARWDGERWSSLGAGLTSVYSLLALPDGDVIAGGDFRTYLGEARNLIARWDGTSWNAMDRGFEGPSYTAVRALAVRPNGSVVAAGTFRLANGAEVGNIAEWNGTEWFSLGTGLDGSVRSLAIQPNGDLIATGSTLRENSPRILYMARWDGSTWTGFPVPEQYLAQVNSVSLLSDGTICIGSNAGAYLYTESGWSTPGTGLDGNILDVETLPDGRLLVGGGFTHAGWLEVNHVAIWDGAGWASLGAGLSGGVVYDVEVAPNGDIFVAGEFQTSGGRPVLRVARWDGALWQPLGSGLDSTVLSIASLPNGDLVAGGFFGRAGGVAANHAARWDGDRWWSMGSDLGRPESFTEHVSSLVATPGGEVIACGTFADETGRIGEPVRRWNGSNWVPLGDLITAWIYAVEVLPEGDLVVGGSISSVSGLQSGNLARWDGTAWSAATSADGVNSTVYSLVRLPNGDLLVGGSFASAGGSPANGLALWDGSDWSTFGPGLEGGGVSAAILSPQGEIVVGGSFQTAGGRHSPYFARYSLTGIPPIADQPDAQTLTDHDTLTISATPAAGYEGVAVRWQRDGVAIVDGPGGASSGGGTVTGAARALASPTNGTPAVLTIVGARMSDSGSYIATFVNACGEVATAAAAVTIRACPADFDADGEVDGDDVVGFFGAWDSNDALADFNNDGGVDSDDVIAFFARWDSGC